MGRISPNFWKLWFDCGVVAGAVLSLGTVTFLIFNLAKSVVVLTTFFSPADDTANPVDPTIMAAFDAAANANAMTIVVPGVSFPLSQLPLFVFAMFIALVVHEAGHGIASSAHSVMPLTVGCVLYAPCFLPSAFVNLDWDHIKLLSSWARLRVFFAGVWHNFVTVLVLSAIMWFQLPHRVLTGCNIFVAGKGAVVTSVPHHSALRSHVHPTDVLVMADSYALRSSSDLHAYLSYRSRPLTEVGDTEFSGLPSGYCVRESAFMRRQLHISPKEKCCNVSTEVEEESGLQCFYYHSDVSGDHGSAFVHVRYEKDKEGSGGGRRRYFCTHADAILNMRKVQMCSTESDCQGPHSRAAFRCIQPSPPPGTALIRLAVVSSKDAVADNGHNGHDPLGAGRHLIFYGPPADLAMAAELGDLTPTNWVRRVVESLSFGFGHSVLASLVRMVNTLLTRFLGHTVAISLCLAVFNSTPVWMFDGQYTTAIITRKVLDHVQHCTLRLLNHPSFTPCVLPQLRHPSDEIDAMHMRSQARKLTNQIVNVCTGVLMINLALAVGKLFIRI